MLRCLISIDLLRTVSGHPKKLAKIWDISKQLFWAWWGCILGRPHKKLLYIAHEKQIPNTYKYNDFWVQIYQFLGLVITWLNRECHHPQPGHLGCYSDPPKNPLEHDPRIFDIVNILLFTEYCEYYYGRSVYCWVVLDCNWLWEIMNVNSLRSLTEVNWSGISHKWTSIWSKGNHNMGKM